MIVICKTRQYRRFPGAALEKINILPGCLMKQEKSLISTEFFKQIALSRQF